MSLTIPNLPSVGALDPSSIPMPSLAEIGDAITTAVDTAGEAATVVARSVQRRPVVAAGLVAASLVAILAVLLVKRSARNRSMAKPAAAERAQLRSTAA